ncbi:hypothetical protein ACTWPT_43660 [Nonomuraea sp. 3N208]|uniref:hypothetical protein n=1 Tax=Nonomuraea sp. 3N208 TaxID=3457421 RepID=UPI003FD4F9DE
MPAQKIRSIVAAATLAAGVTWLAVAATQANACGDKGRAVAASDRNCGEGRGPYLNDGTPGAGALSPEAVQPSVATGQLARLAGLAGLAAGNPAPGLADLGGMVATWDMPSLASGSPGLLPTRTGRAGMEDRSTAAHVPALPPLPLPGTALMERVPNETAIGHGPNHAKAPAVTTHDPKGVEKPMHTIGTKLIGEVLPTAMPGLGNTSIPPGGAAGMEGLAGLVKGVTLR